MMQQIQRTNSSRKFQENKIWRKPITVTIEESQGKIHIKGKYGREGKELSTLEEGRRVGMLKRILREKVRDQHIGSAGRKGSTRM